MTVNPLQSTVETATVAADRTVDDVNPFTAAFQVALSTLTSGTTIEYTTDGSDPKISGPALTYSGTPLSLSATTEVRAYASRAGPFFKHYSSKALRCFFFV